MTRSMNAVSQRRTTMPKTRVGKQRKPPKALKLPHERDESPATTSKDPLAISGPRGVIEQAARDIKEGRRDTDLRGIPNDVPPSSDAKV